MVERIIFYKYLRTSNFFVRLLLFFTKTYLRKSRILSSLRKKKKQIYYFCCIMKSIKISQVPTTVYKFNLVYQSFNVRFSFAINYNFQWNFELLGVAHAYLLFYWKSRKNFTYEISWNSILHFEYVMTLTYYKPTIKINTLIINWW